MTAAPHFDEHAAVASHDGIAAIGPAAVYSVLAGNSTTVASIALELKNMGATADQVAMTFATIVAAMLQEACGSRAEARSLAGQWARRIAARSVRTVLARNSAGLLQLTGKLLSFFHSFGRTFGAPGLTVWTSYAAGTKTQGDQSVWSEPEEAAEVAGVIAAGGSFAASFRRGPYGRGGCRARHPRHRPSPAPAATSPASRAELIMP